MMTRLATAHLATVVLLSAWLAPAEAATSGLVSIEDEVVASIAAFVKAGRQV